MEATKPHKTNASIVTYKTDPEELRRCLDTLQASDVAQIYVIDNARETSIAAVCEACENVWYIGNENRGYGAGHNIALRKSIAEGADYHVVMNSDIAFDGKDIGKLTAYMEAHPDVGQVQPLIVNPDETLQYTCRLLPTPCDLIFRRFLPGRLAAKRDERYLLKRFDHQTEANVPYHQGSFMVLRTRCLERVGVFDERYFMYPEDIDLTRRMHRYYRTMFVPCVKVVHDHRAASYKSLRMTMVHIVNMMRYFNKWGWIFDNERKRVNAKTLAALGL